MATEKQKSANRRNASRSTGPRTDAGKAASAQNSTTHGLTASSATILEESADAYRAFSQALHDELRPASTMQRELVDRIAFLSWKLRRIPTAERTIFDDSSVTPMAPNEYHGPKKGWLQKKCVGSVLAGHMRRDSYLQRLQNYEIRIERSLHATLRQLAAVKKIEGEREPSEPGESISQNEPNSVATAGEAMTSVDSIPEGTGEIESVQFVPCDDPDDSPAVQALADRLDEIHLPMQAMRDAVERIL